MLIKSISLLLLSSSMLMAVPMQEIKKSSDSELAKRQTIVAYSLMTLGVFGFAAGAGKTMASWLPEKTHYVLKVAVFVPAALVGAAIEVAILRDDDMLNFYKKHKWLLLGL